MNAQQHLSKAHSEGRYGPEALSSYIRQAVTAEALWRRDTIMQIPLPDPLTVHVASSDTGGSGLPYLAEASVGPNVTLSARGASAAEAVNRLMQVFGPAQPTETHESSPSIAEVARKPLRLMRRIAVTAPDIEAMLRKAAGTQKVVDIKYRGLADDYPKWRAVEVQSVAFGRGQKKVVYAYCRKADGFRSFSLDRIEAAEMED